MKWQQAIDILSKFLQQWHGNLPKWRDIGARKGEKWSRKFATSYEYLVAKSENLVAKTFSHFIKGGEHDCSVPGYTLKKIPYRVEYSFMGKLRYMGLLPPLPQGIYPPSLPPPPLFLFLDPLFGTFQRLTPLFLHSLSGSGEYSGKIGNRGENREYTDGYMDAGNTWGYREYIGIQGIIIISVPIIN